jgi:hypothetical protein
LFASSATGSRLEQATRLSATITGKTTILMPQERRCAV